MLRTVFYVSGGTGITAEKLGRSLLAQFESLEFDHVTLPFIDSIEKAEEVVQMIDIAAKKDSERPIVFDTLIDKSIQPVIQKGNGYFIDVFGTYLKPLEKELSLESLEQAGRSHRISEEKKYQNRIEAINFTLNNDDGARTHQYKDADIILTGVSRCGKTPICLYLAMQFGIRAANYPLTVDDIDSGKLPRVLLPHRHKLFGLTIDVERLSLVRNERQPNSRYASIRQCQYEVDEAEFMLDRLGISYQNTATQSIEEVSVKILAKMGVEKRC